MKKIEIYTSPLCGYCHAAKHLLDANGLDYVEYNVMMDSSRKAEMLQRSDGRRTVPQIFVDSVGIGGYTELRRLHSNNELDALLNSSA